jgi:NAD-dependent SIR2 family protein deacetylase
MDTESVVLAAAKIKQAAALIITAGAGMGVDSGLPDFRGPAGFWRAYPHYEKLGIAFEQAANPRRFAEDPTLAWGFYGHRLHLYRHTKPHQGFYILKKWIETFKLPYFVITSNVDGAFQQAGFDPDHILEIHGSIHYLQCNRPCSRAIWENDFAVPIDMTTMRAHHQHLPLCPKCGQLARPNILMFSDYAWISDRTDDQENNWDLFYRPLYHQKIVVIELGAGEAVPTIRITSERLTGNGSGNAFLVRINPRDTAIPKGHAAVVLAMGAKAGLEAIDAVLNS